MRRNEKAPAGAATPAEARDETVYGTRASSDRIIPCLWLIAQE